MPRADHKTVIIEGTDRSLHCSDKENRHYSKVIEDDDLKRNASGRIFPMVKRDFDSYPKEERRRLTLSESLETKLTNLITQLERAKQIQETPHCQTIEIWGDGEKIRLDYKGLIGLLKKMLKCRMPFDPFVMQLAYGYIGQTDYRPRIGAAFESVDTVTDTILKKTNPVLWHALYNLILSLSGCQEPLFGGFDDLGLVPTKYMSPTIHLLLSAELENVQHEPGESPLVKKAQYAKAPESDWPVAGYISWHTFLKAGQMSRLLGRSYYRGIRLEEIKADDILSKQDQSKEFDEMIKLMITGLWDVFDQIAYDKIPGEDRWRSSQPLYDMDGPWRERSSTLWLGEINRKSILLYNTRNYKPRCKTEDMMQLSRVFKRFYDAIKSNDKWYQSRGMTYQYYFRYLFNAYEALDRFITEYVLLQNKERFYDKRLPQEPIEGLKAIRDHYYKKLMVLTEIKLNRGWSDVVSQGERFDLNAVFGDAVKQIEKMPTYSCMKDMFKSKEWCFLQGKIANSVLYYRTHPELLKEDDFEVLLSFAKNLLQHHNDLIRKEVRNQLIVMGVVFTLAVASLTALTIPGGALAHLSLGSLEIAVVLECIVGFAHLGFGLHELFEKIAHLSTVDDDLPLDDLRKKVKETLIRPISQVKKMEIDDLDLERRPLLGGGDFFKVTSDHRDHECGVIISAVEESTIMDWST